MLKFIYIAMLIYFVFVLVKFVVNKPEKWNWLMGAMVLAPWILRIFLIK